MRRLALAMLVCAAACGRKGSERTCERTIDAAFERVKLEQGKSGVPSAGSAIVAGTRLTMIASCEAEKWSDDVLRCIETARLEVDLTACQGKLTHDQWEQLQRKLSTLRASVSPPEPPPDAAPVPIATPIDAPVGVLDAPLSVDAAIIQPEPPPRVVPPVQPPIDAAPAAPAEDCSKVMRRPMNEACRRQFCATHENDPRCQIE